MERWERRADEIDATCARMTEWLIAALAPKHGDVVLELAAGPGSVGLAASPLVGEGGRVIATDFSPAMVEVARRIVASGAPPTPLTSEP